MAKFRFDHYIDIHWNGYDIVGDGGTIFSIPDQLYEEFESDLRPVEPSLEWTVVNEFLELQNSVSVATLTGTAPIVVADTSVGRNISLNANYQTAGTYVTSVAGTAPITASGTTSITVGIDQTAITANSATNSEVLRTYVKNTSGSDMTKGQAVYINGATGTNVTIQLATASTEAGSSKTLGLLAQDLANNAFGYVIENGLLAGIDTSSATAGSSVWLGNTPGSLVYNAPPADPANSVYLGVVARSNNNNGEIVVKVQNGYELDELHDVTISSVTNGQALIYNSSTSAWTNQTITTGGVATVSGTAPITTSGTTAVTVAINQGSTSAVGALQLTDSISSTSTTTAATPNAVKTAYDIATAGWEAFTFGTAGIVATAPKFLLGTTTGGTSGQIQHTRLVPHRTITISNIAFVSSTPAASVPTLIRFGIYTRSGTTFTLVARTASDTTIFNATFTKFTRALDTTGGYPATYTLTAGAEYFVSVIQVATTGATILAQTGRSSTAPNTATGPQFYTHSTQSDLVTSSTGTLATTQSGNYAELS